MSNEEIYEKYKNNTLTKEQKKENIKRHCSFYRRNINLYASRYLGIKLHPFQHIMLYLMCVSQVFFAICSRGLSKTFIVGLYAVCKCLLFPYSEVHLTSSTIVQATKMVKDKIENELCKKLSPVLKYYYDKELIKIHYGKEEVYIEFLMNGSKMWVDPATDSARGGRATLIIYEECRLLKKTIIDSVFEKMAHPRQAMYLITRDEYKNDERWIEPCQSLYITSARFKNEWFWRLFKTVVEETYNNKKIKYNFFCSDIFLAIECRLKTVSDYFKARKTSGEYDFRMEDLNEMIGEAEDAFFSRDMFKKNQISENPFIFPTNNDINIGNNLHNRRKVNGEIRLLWIDFAFANTTGKEANDQSVIGCTSLIPKDGKYIRFTDYITTYPASDSDGIDLRIREMYFDYEADYIILDLRNGGEVMYNDLTKPREHPYRDKNLWNSHGFTIAIEKEYQAVQPAKLDDLAKRTIDEQPIPCIIPIQATDEFNSNMWLDLQKRLRDEEIILLIEDIDFENKFSETEDYYKMSSEELAKVMKPYLMTMNLICEATDLSQEWRNGKVKLTESRSGTKDIIVSFAYGNIIATKIINKMEQFDPSDFDESDFYEIYNY